MAKKKMMGCILRQTHTKPMLWDILCPPSSGLQGPVTVAMNRPQWQGQGCERAYILNMVCVRVCGCVRTSNACKLLICVYCIGPSLFVH